MSNNKKVIKSNTVLTAPNPKRLGAFLIDQIVLYAYSLFILPLLV